MPEPATPDPSRAAVERAARDAWGRVLATLTGLVRDLELAEDALQDAVVVALRHWPAAGVPREPAAWLLQTAKRKAIDRLRRDARFRARRDELQRQLAVREREGEARAAAAELDVDHRLSMIFTCCHPALAEPARVALTLRTLGGLSTTEIARAFLVPETTMAQRLVRAKRKIAAAGIPYRVPPPELWPERLESVLAVVYLVFNEGYRATTSPRLVRDELCDEAIRLGRLVVALAPDEPEVRGLLALMLLHDSRRVARTDDAGRLVPLDEQERGRWDRERIAEGEAELRLALAARRPGPYQIQAAISAVHAAAPSAADTDWPQIAGLYRALGELRPSPVVRLNEAVARSYADGVEAGLRALDGLAASGSLERYQPFHAARADLLRRAGRAAEARDAYRRAIELSENAAERTFLARRLASVDPGTR